MSLLRDITVDIRHALRVLMGAPIFSAAAITVLCVGLSSTLAPVYVMSAVSGSHAQHMDGVHEFDVTGPGAVGLEALNRLEHTNALLQPFADTFWETGAVPASGGSVDGAVIKFVSPRFFSMVQVRPLIGRLTDERDFNENAPTAVVLGCGYWQRDFHADPNVASRKLTIRGRTTVIIGVLPCNFSGITGMPSSLWMPTSAIPLVVNHDEVTGEALAAGAHLYGRLKRGTREADIRRVVPSVALRLLSHPTVHAETIIFAGVWFSLLLLVLIIASVNVANMLLARGIQRIPEINIRIALGAGRARLIQQLVIENLLLAGISCVLSLVGARSIARYLLRVTGTPPEFAAGFNLQILFAAMALTLLASAIFGLFPAMQTARRRVRYALWRKALVAVQVCASCTLLVTSTFLTLGIRHYVNQQLSFDYKRVVVIDPSMLLEDVPAERARRLLGRLVDDARSAPGVESATLSGIPPAGSRLWVVKDVHSNRDVCVYDVDSSYFAAMNLQIVEGRAFSPREREVAVLDKASVGVLARGRKPLGAILDLDAGQLEVVGVAAGVGQFDRGICAAHIYVPIGDSRVPFAEVLVRTATDAAQALPALRASVERTSRALKFATLNDMLSERLSRIEMTASLLRCLSAFAILIAALGIVALISFAVQQQRFEIGVRMALGAPRATLVRWILRQHMFPVTAGLIGSLPFAAICVYLVRTGLFGMSVFDPRGYLVALGMAGTLAVAAALMPALRAFRIEPNELLREH